MNIKYSPLLYILVFYLLLCGYLFLAYTDFHQYLASVDAVDLVPLAYIVLGTSITLFILAAFSLLRIPVFHYLFNMLHLWLLLLAGGLLYSYITYEIHIAVAFDSDIDTLLSEHRLAINAMVFSPLVYLVDSVLALFRGMAGKILFAVVILGVLIQLMLYMPVTLRYIYHTDFSSLRYAIKHVFVSLVLLAPLLFAANVYLQRDDNPASEMAALLQAKPAPVADSDNAFYPMLTLWSTGDGELSAAGRQWLAEFNQMMAWFEKHKQPVVPANYPGIDRLRLGGMIADDRAAINQLYIKRLYSDGTPSSRAISQYGKKYNSALNSLAAIHTFRKYANPLPYNGISHTHFYQDYQPSHLALHRLYLLMILLAYEAKPDQLVTEIGKDMQLNQLVIRQSNDPLVKSLFIEKQSITVELAHVLLKKDTFNSKSMHNLIAKLPVPDFDAINTRYIAHTELGYMDRQLKTIRSFAVRSELINENVIDYVFKPNRTLNCIYADLAKVLNLQGKSLQDYLASQGRVMRKASLINIVGDAICISYAQKHVGIDTEKLIELKGKLIILRARSAARKSGIPDLNMTAFLNNNQGKYANPVTGEALKWDRETRRIYFEFTVDNKKTRVAL
jgi:hypothetical protein